MTGDAAVELPTRQLKLAADRGTALQDALADGACALHLNGDLQASRQNFERAYWLAEQAGDGPAMALAVVGLGGLWVSESRGVTGTVRLEARLQHVLSMLDADSPLALRIRARVAGEADYGRGTHAGILAVLGEARAAADPVALAEALSIAHHCLLGPDHGTLRRELAVELIKDSFRTGRRSDLLMGLLWQTIDCYAEGGPHAGRHLAELRDHLGQRSHLAVGFVVSAIDVMLAIRAGRFDEAESLAGICATSGAGAGDVDHEWWPRAQLVAIRWYQGRLVELLPMLRDRVHSPVLSAVDNSAVAALAVAAALSGDRPTAASSLAGLCGSDLALLPRSSSWLVTMNGIVEAAYVLEDAAVAARAYELLRPYAHLRVAPSRQITEELRTQVKVTGTRDPDAVRTMLRNELIGQIGPGMDRTLHTGSRGDRPSIVLIVGVNGTGKTTVAGKLGSALIGEGQTVVLGAADTFRAAAADQLQTWGERIGAHRVRSDREGADPASVAFEAVAVGIDERASTVIVDTAGRLHTKTGLMDELGKIKRVISRSGPPWTRCCSSWTPPPARTACARQACSPRRWTSPGSS